MRIGLITGEYPPMQGGIGAHCAVLARQMKSQGHTVTVFTDPQARDAEIPLTSASNVWGWRTLRAVKRWTVRERLDIVNLHFQTAAFGMSAWVHFLPEFLRPLPVITTFHDLRFPYLFPKAGSLRHWIVMRLARASAGVVATNHEDMERLEHLPSALIPIGSSVEPALPPDFDCARFRARVAGAGQYLVGHFGFINHSKGIEVLLESVAALRRDGLPLKLVMIGGRTGSSDPTNAGYADQIDAQIARLGLSDALHWTGFVDDRSASAYFAAVDGIALPFLDGASYRRSSLMAAIAHHSAIITTQPTVEVPAFQDGENMLLVPASDAAALANAIHRLMESHDLRQRLRAGAAALKQHFDWDTIARTNVDFFRRVLEAAQ